MTELLISRFGVRVAGGALAVLVERVVIVAKVEKPR